MAGKEIKRITFRLNFSMSMAWLVFSLIADQGYIILPFDVHR